MEPSFVVQSSRHSPCAVRPWRLSLRSPSFPCIGWGFASSATSHPRFVAEVIYRLLLVVAMVSCSALPAGAEPPSNDVALDRAFASLKAYDWGQSRSLLGPIDDALLTTRNDPAGRLQLEQRLAAVLATDAPLAAKQFVCRKLALIGSEASVPALAPLLTAPRLSHMARYALERIPGPTVDRVLLTALAKADDRLKPGLIDSLGSREYAEAVPQLGILLHADDAAVAAAAAQALGKIASPHAARMLGEFRAAAPASLKDLVTDAWVTAAEHLAKRGSPGEAEEIFDRLYPAGKENRWRLAGFRGVAATRPAMAFCLINNALHGHDADLRALAARLIAETSDAELVDIVQLLDDYPAPSQAALLDAVRLRLGADDLPVLRKAARSSDPAVQLAALRALALVGDGQDVPWLLELAAQQPRGAATEAAQWALASIPGKDVNAALATALFQARPEVQVVAIRSLAARGAVAGVAAVGLHLADRCESVRLEAWAALAKLGSPQQLATVVQHLKSASDDRTRTAAEKALFTLVRRAGASGYEAVAAGLDGADPLSRVALLRSLSMIGDARSLQAVRRGVKDADPQVRDAAVKVLTDWPNAEEAPELLQIARTSDKPVWRTLALRGYVRLARDKQVALPQRVEMLTSAMALAAGTDDKRLVLAGLAELSDPAVLRLLAPCLDEAEIADEASIAVVKVAAALDGGHRAEAAAVLRRVVKASKNPELKKQAGQLLERLSH